MPTPVNNIVNPAITGTSQSGTTGSSSIDKQAFLKLLTAQLKYQDPVNPLSSDQFMGQMAQFSTLEQMTNLSASTEQSLWNSQLTQAVQTIGRKVTWVDGDTQQSKSGVVSGVTIEDKQIMLQVGDQKVPVSLIMGVSEA